MKNIRNASLVSNEVKSLVRTIEAIIDVDLDKAKELLSSVDKNNNSIEYQYLYWMIREKEIYSEYDSKMKEKYDEHLSKGIAALDVEDYNQAYKMFAAGYDATKNNMFNYYMGKALFKGGNKRASYPYFVGYSRFGGSKLPKALLYTMSAYCEMRNKKKAKKYYAELAYINEVFNHNFDLASPFNKNSKFKCKKRIILSEDDFVDKAQTLDFNDYYNYGFDEKVIIIESLFRNGKYNEALNLLNELNPTDKSQKRKIQELVKNKILYKNKR